MKPLFIPLPGNDGMATRLASLLDADLGGLELHVFPDGECLPRFADDLSGRIVVMVCTLNHPDEKALPLLFAADAARDQGAASVALIAPYLCYMRQDRRFHPGEAVTSRSFARLVSGHFNWLLTIDPHLHRYRDLGEIYTIPAKALHVAPALADWLGRNVAKPFLIGPDQESRQWIEAVAAACGAPWDVLQKVREGDRIVALRGDHLQLPAGATPVLLDDIISSGATMLEALRAVGRHTESPAVVAAIHCLAGAELRQALSQAGARLVTCNTVPGDSASIDVGPILAEGLLALLAGVQAPTITAMQRR